MVAPISFLIEFLAAIPSIAFGLWGILVLAPFMHDHAEPFLRDTIGRSWLFHGMFFDPSGVEYNSTGHNLFSGGLILGIMILPIITAISRDVLRNVPRAKIEATVALGSTWWQSSKEMLKYSRSGLFGAIMLGLARAAGETMAITKLIGNSQQIKASIFLPAETMSSLLASKFDGATDIERSALLEVALILLVMSLVFNVVALAGGRQERPQRGGRLITHRYKRLAAAANPIEPPRLLIASNAGALNDDDRDRAEPLPADGSKFARCVHALGQPHHVWDVHRLHGAHPVASGAGDAVPDCKWAEMAFTRVLSEVSDLVPGSAGVARRHVERDRRDDHPHYHGQRPGHPDRHAGRDLSV